LYGTSACHLCDEAAALVASAAPAGCGIEVRSADISDSDALLARYGQRIPVLRDAAGRELDWPFTAATLRRFLAG